MIFLIIKLPIILHFEGKIRHLMRAFTNWQKCGPWKADVAGFGGRGVIWRSDRSDPPWLRACVGVEKRRNLIQYTVGDQSNFRARGLGFRLGLGYWRFRLISHFYLFTLRLLFAFWQSAI